VQTTVATTMVANHCDNTIRRMRMECVFGMGSMV
jgi:hypothetical protein